MAALWQLLPTAEPATRPAASMQGLGSAECFTALCWGALQQWSEQMVCGLFGRMRICGFFQPQWGQQSEHACGGQHCCTIIKACVHCRLHNVLFV